MPNLINDGSLVGFWPLNEPSGAPFFKNYSPAYSKYPSGISFDMHVSIANNHPSTLLKQFANSVWPGTFEFVNQESGVLIQGYQAPGHWKLSTDASPYSRYLTLGGGGRQQAEQCLAPAVANSGFTVGIWAYPYTNGNLRANEDSSSIGGGNNRHRIAFARSHALMGQFSPFVDNGGWMMGVSGRMDRGAQFDNLDTAQSLHAYVSMTKASNTAPDLFLETPIESGRYTHIAISYRYVDGTNNELVLYKDGRVTASGITNDDLVLSNGNLISSSQARAFAIGAGDGELASQTNRYPYTTGWNNLVSGVYYFRRVLDEGEVLDLHERGGLVPEESVVSPAKEVELTDPDLAAYHPIHEQGFADISVNHRPLIADVDMGYVSTGPLPMPGPFGGGSFHNDGIADYRAYVATSGACHDILSQGSWTIGLNIASPNTNNRETEMVFSWGSVTEVTSATALPISNPLVENSAGICCTVSGITNQQRYVIEVYPDGSVSSTETLVFNINGAKEYYNGAVCHLALAYDDSTLGIAAYLNGVLQSSGTLSQSLTTQLSRVAGSGFPLMFSNGIKDGLTNSIGTTSNRGTHDNAGRYTIVDHMFAIKRALLPSEVRAIALSGINVVRTERSRHDPRLMGYWPSSDFKIDDIVVDDQAMCWQEVPGDLIRGDAFAKQERWYDRAHNETDAIFRDDATARYDQFASRTLPPELASYGNLGITSGTFSVKGGTVGTANVGNSLHSRSSIGNLSSRYKPNYGERDQQCQNVLGDFVLSYEVTPSGDIPATILGLNATTTAPAFNSALHTYTSSLTAATTTRSFLTTLDAGSNSGVVVAWFGEDNVPLVSGTIPYGVPSRVLMHGKFVLPYNTNGFTNGTTPYRVEMWVDGNLVNAREATAATLKAWPADTPDSAGDVRSLSFGGVIGNPTAYTTELTLDSGLGDIYLREIFTMRGGFSSSEIAALAASGIQSPVIPGFANSKTKTQVSIANSDLVAYYRFNGFEGGGSGTTDLSLNSNHMFGAQQSIVENGLGTHSLGAYYLRAIPGPFEASDIAVQASGFTYSSLLPTNSAQHQMPPFMASGTRFNSPNADFSVGFFYIKKDDTSAAEFDTIVSYGVIPTTASNTSTNDDYGWCIGVDEQENMRLTVSLNDGSAGNMYFRPLSVASQAKQKYIGAFGDSTPSFNRDLSIWPQYSQGSTRNPRASSWAHYCWVYNSAGKEFFCYLNGDLVDRRRLGANQTPNIPTEAARYLTFMQHTSAPWSPGSNVTGDHDGVMTDFFYFDSQLTQAEVRYISQNGIDSATGTVTSGVVGGFIHGQDTGSGIIGGFAHGQDTGSGLFGGYMPGGIEGSGTFGGYVSGVVFGDGTVGGWIRGLDDVSGILGGFVHGVDVGSGSIAGYIRGQEVGSGLFGGMIFASEAASGVIGGHILGADQASGIIGGFILGGLQRNFEFDAGFTVDVLSAKDFDAQLEIAKTVGSDFDAKVVIFQDEQPPLVDIIIPDVSVSGLVPPFNQYFIAKASGQQGKTIDSTKWTFGDLTPAETVAESGAGCYPIQHRYASSGFFIAKFEAIDSDGMHASATRIISAASGIDPVIVSLSGTPRSGDAGLIVDFDTDINILPPGVSISTQLLYFDDGQTTIAFNPTHNYTQPGTYKPIWCVRDSRGVIWCDSLESGSDFLNSQK